MAQNGEFGETYKVQVEADLTTFLNGLNNAVKSINKFNDTFQQNINGLNQSVNTLNSTLTEFNKQLTKVNQKTTQSSRSMKKETESTFGSLITNITVTIAFFGKLVGALTLGALAWTWYRDGTLRTIFTIATLSRTLGELTGAFAGVAAVLGQVLPGQMGKTFRGLNFMFNMLVSLIKNVTNWRNSVIDATKGMNRSNRSLLDVFKDVSRKYTVMWESIIQRGAEGDRRVTNIFNKLRQTIRWYSREAVKASKTVLFPVKAEQIPLPGFEVPTGLIKRWTEGIKTSISTLIEPAKTAVRDIAKEFDIGIQKFGGPTTAASIKNSIRTAARVNISKTNLIDKLAEVSGLDIDEITALTNKAEAGNRMAIKKLSSYLVKVNADFEKITSRIFMGKGIDDKALTSMIRSVRRGIQLYTEAIRDSGSTLFKTIDTEYGNNFSKGLNKALGTVKVASTSFWRKTSQSLNEGVKRIGLGEDFTASFVTSISRGLEQASSKISQSAKSLWGNITQALTPGSKTVGKDIAEQLTFSFVEQGVFSKLSNFIALSFAALVVKVKGAPFFKSLKNFYNQNFTELADGAAKSFTEGFAKRYGGADQVIKGVSPLFESIKGKFKLLGKAFEDVKGLESVPNIFKSMGVSGVVLTAVLEALIFKTGQIVAAIGTGFIQAGASGIKVLAQMAEVSAHTASAMASLTAAVEVYHKTTGDSTKGVQYWTQFLKEMADATGASRLELMKSGGAIIDMAASLGASQTEIEKFTKGVIAVARLQGRTIYEVARTVRGAIAGNATSLIILGASLEDVGMSYEGLSNELAELDNKLTGTALKQARFKKIMEVLGPSIDQAAVLTNHFVAAVARLQGAWTNLIAGVGRGAESFLTKILDSITAIIDAIDELPEPIKRFVGTASLVASFGAVIGGVSLKIAGLAMELGALAVLVVTVDQVLKALTGKTLLNMVAIVAKAATGVEVLNFSSLGAGIKTISQMIYGIFGPSVGYITVALGFLRTAIFAVGKSLLRAIPYFLLFEIAIKVISELEAETKIFSNILKFIVNILSSVGIAIYQVIGSFEWLTTDVAKAITVLLKLVAIPISDFFAALNKIMGKTNKEMKNSKVVWLGSTLAAGGFKTVLLQLLEAIPGVGTGLKIILLIVASLAAAFINLSKLGSSIKNLGATLQDTWGKLITITPEDVRDWASTLFTSLKTATDEAIEQLINDLSKSSNVGKIGAAIVATFYKMPKIAVLKGIELLGASGSEEQKKYIENLRSTIETIRQKIQQEQLAIGDAEVDASDKRIQNIRGMVLELKSLEDLLAEIELQPVKKGPKEIAKELGIKETSELYKLLVKIFSVEQEISKLDISKLPSKLIDPTKKLKDLKILTDKITLNELNTSILEGEKTLSKMTSDLMKVLSAKFPSGGAIDKLIASSKGKDIGYIMDLISKAQDKSTEEGVAGIRESAEKELTQLFATAGVPYEQFIKEVNSYNKDFTDKLGAGWDDVIKKLKEKRDEVEALKKKFQETSEITREFHLLNIRGFSKEGTILNEIIDTFEKFKSVGGKATTFVGDAVKNLLRVFELLGKDPKTLTAIEVEELNKLKPFMTLFVDMGDLASKLGLQFRKVKDTVRELGLSFLKFAPIQEEVTGVFDHATEAIAEYNEMLDRLVDIDLTQTFNELNKHITTLDESISKSSSNKALQQSFQLQKDQIQNAVNALKGMKDLKIDLPTFTSEDISSVEKVDAMIKALEAGLIEVSNINVNVLSPEQAVIVEKTNSALAATLSLMRDVYGESLRVEARQLEIGGGTFEQVLANRIKQFRNALRKDLRLESEDALDEIVDSKWYADQLDIMTADTQAFFRNIIQQAHEARQAMDPSVRLAADKEFLRSQAQQLLDAQAAVDPSTGLASLVSGFKYAYKTIINETRSASEDVRDMWRSIFDNLQSTFADFGKALVYGNRDVTKQLKSQRDEDFASTKEQYDERKQRLDEDLANGKTTYFQYYEELRELDNGYHKDISDAQRKFEQDMKNSLTTIQSLWEKFWRAMIDAAIEMLAQQAIQGIFSSIGGMFSPASPSTTGTSTGWAKSNAGGYKLHEGGLIGDVLKGIKSFHAGGLNSGEVLIKALRSEYILSPQATRSIGTNTLDRMNRTGELPEQTKQPINIFNVTDMSSLPSLGPNDVVNIISWDIAKRGQTYKSLVVMR